MPRFSVHILARRLAAPLLLAAFALWPLDSSALGLSVEQLVRLVKVVKDKGTDLTLPAPVIAALRFDPDQVQPTIRQVSMQGDDGVKHGFAPLHGASAGYFLFQRRSASDVLVFHVDQKLSLVAAARQFGPARFVALPANEGDRELAQEFARWSQVLSAPADSLPDPTTARKPSR